MAKISIQQKHDIEANWLKATNFIPKVGEIIVYDKDDNYGYARVKIGDGATLVSNLPFIDADLAAKIQANTNAISVLTNGSDPSTIDSVNDLINYVNEHGAEVIGIQNDIDNLEGEVRDINIAIGGLASQEYVDSAIASIPEGFSGSWNDLTEKPFGETTVKGDTLTWDGNTDGLMCVGGAFYKISDATPTENDFANGFSVVVGGEVMEFSKEMVSEMVAMIGADVLSFGGGFVAYTDGASANDGGFIFPEAGIYFYYEDDSKMTSITIPNYNGFETTVIKPLDEKYLPESIIPEITIQKTSDEEGKEYVSLLVNGTVLFTVN